MSAIGIRGDGLDRLVDRHRELCETFDGKGQSAPEAILLIAPNVGKNTAECLADLVDQALAVYEGSGFTQDPSISSLKIALTEAIQERV